MMCTKPHGSWNSAAGQGYAIDCLVHDNAIKHTMMLAEVRGRIRWALPYVCMRTVRKDVNVSLKARPNPHQTKPYLNGRNEKPWCGQVRASGATRELRLIHTVVEHVGMIQLVLPVPASATRGKLPQIAGKYNADVHVYVPVCEKFACLHVCVHACAHVYSCGRCTCRNTVIPALTVCPSVLRSKCRYHLSVMCLSCIMEMRMIDRKTMHINKKNQKNIKHFHWRKIRNVGTYMR